MTISTAEILNFLLHHTQFFHQICCTFFGAIVTALFANRREIHQFFNIDPPGPEKPRKYTTRKSLRRYLALDFLVFTPAIVILMYFSFPALVYRLTGYIMFPRSDYILLGILSYGFPLKLVKETIQKKLLTTIRRELVSVLKEASDEEAEIDSAVEDHDRKPVQEPKKPAEKGRKGKSR